MITIQQQLDAARRELALRHRVYPGRVDRHRMTAKKAAYEIAAMEAIIVTLTELETKTRLV